MRDWLRNRIPTADELSNNRYLKIFGQLIFKPAFWCFNRRAVTRAVAVGLFSALIPVPFQMFLAAGLAVLFRANLPISVALVWITNPITMPPIFYVCYRVGTYLLDTPSHPIEMSWSWLSYQMSHAWQPLLLGSLCCAVVLAVLGYALSSLLWRLAIRRQWKNRKRSRSKA